MNKRQKRIRANDQIMAAHIRLIGAGGEQLGVIPVREGLQMAKDEGLDLVEVAPQSVHLGDARSLVSQGRHGDPPALAFHPETILHRHAQVVEEELGENLATRHVLDGPNGEAR